jgi:hypothetical protein
VPKCDGDNQSGITEEEEDFSLGKIGLAESKIKVKSLIRWCDEGTQNKCPSVWFFRSISWERLNIEAVWCNVGK